MRAVEAQRIMRDRTEVVQVDRDDFATFVVQVDGQPIGWVVHVDGQGWSAVRPHVSARTAGVELVDRGRSRRHAAVRRLLMSHPSSSFERELSTGRDTPR